MSVTYSTAVKTARMQAVADAIDGGAGPGYIEIGTTGMGTVLATLTLPDPCGTAAAGVLTLDMAPDLSAAAVASGTAAAARIRTSAGTDCVTGLTVGTSGTDLIVDDTDVSAGVSVILTAGTITHA